MKKGVLQPNKFFNEKRGSTAELNSLMKNNIVTNKTVLRPNRSSRLNNAILNSIFFIKEFNVLCDIAKSKNNAITNSPKKPASSDPNFSDPEMPEVDSIEKALIKLV